MGPLDGVKSSDKHRFPIRKEIKFLCWFYIFSDTLQIQYPKFLGHKKREKHDNIFLLLTVRVWVCDNTTQHNRQNEIRAKYVREFRLKILCSVK
jgi:hypothetical protein